jgi:uncharacterized LabA/DUF88 family protein
MLLRLHRPPQWKLGHFFVVPISSTSLPIAQLGENLAKVSFFIDGFNVYHSLKDPMTGSLPKAPKYAKFLWLDYYKFLKRFAKKGDTISDIFYFSAYAHWRSPGVVKRHRMLIDAWQSTGIKPILGAFKEKDRFCPKCKSYSKGHEEKQTDVNIAIYLIKEAFINSYDVGIILTNDTDLIPAIKMLKSTFPKKKIGVLFPIDRWSSELAQECHFWRKTRKKDLSKSQFPNTFTLPSGIVCSRPPLWK